ncbi:uncharacterized protein VTP21DRAFT_177 [Calcarisporiella thermophila]|uniref:uncharacterized protein n=1 Tax=Calcarisporiella thermophila TaxID=911321 RepID=UPI0037440550
MGLRRKKAAAPPHPLPHPLQAPPRVSSDAASDEKTQVSHFTDRSSEDGADSSRPSTPLEKSSSVTLTRPTLAASSSSSSTSITPDSTATALSTTLPMPPPLKYHSGFSRLPTDRTDEDSVEWDETLPDDVASTLPPKDSFHLVYWIFVLHGISMLLPWNVFITASDFFSRRFAGTPYADSFQNYFSICYNVPNLVFLILALMSKKLSFSWRIKIAIVANVIVMLLLALSAMTAALGTGEVYFKVILTLVAIMGASAALYQNGIFSLVSQFPAIYMQAVMSGQGIGGVSVALAQILTTVTVGSGINVSLGDVQLSAFRYFIFAFSISFTSFVGNFVLLKLPVYKYYTTYSEADSSVFSTSETVLDGISQQKPTIRQVLPKIVKPAFSVTYVFLITLALFPSITSLIHSVTPTKSRFFANDVFVGFHFLLFNIGDIVGRVMPGFRLLQLTNGNMLVWGSLLRTAFIPLFLICNVDVTPRRVQTLITNDGLYFFIMFLFSVSNGYLGSLSMMAAPQVRGIRQGEKDLVGSLMAVFLTAGLVLGSVFSFPLRMAA